MKWFLLSLLFFVVPQLVFGADQSGIVSCTGADCTFCDVVTTIANIVTFLFKLLTIIAVLVLVYTGFRLVTSAGNPSALEEAKGMFSNVVIGFVIIISAWLVVDTVMKALVDQTPPSADGSGGFGPWNEFSANCGKLNSTADSTADSAGLINQQSGGGFATPGESGITDSAPNFFTQEQFNNQTSGGVATPGENGSADITGSAPRFTNNDIRDGIQSSNPNVINTYTGAFGTPEHQAFVASCKDSGGSAVLQSGSNDTIECRTSESQSDDSTSANGGGSFTATEGSGSTVCDGYFEPHTDTCYDSVINLGATFEGEPGNIRDEECKRLAGVYDYELQECFMR